MTLSFRTLVNIISAAAIFALAIPTMADVNDLRNRSPDDLKRQSDRVWDENLRPGAFQDREINENPTDAVIELKAPYRSEDPSVVPVSIHSKIPQTADRYIKKLHIYLDKNPLPLVGVFEFTPESGKADLAMRIRVDSNTYFRVVTEMNNGELLMSKSFIRSLGGCSEPLGASVDESLKRMGKMKMNTVGDVTLGEPNLMQLKISHPNITGLGASQRTGVKPPPHFVKEIIVSYEGNIVLKADLTFAISQDPSFRFFFTPEKEGDMVVVAVDTKNNEFKSTHSVTL
ncbi:MAG: quinoprotein dehydrogenase-associated SoxYZ-like carrier [Gammaproteobacteria bacterium]|nr:MAG: quinoprotein dehydrogenase-associated SoxYZ-like carrier [Gammaproteobacteria bacterium]